MRSLYFNGVLSNSELAGMIRLSTPKINSLLNELIQDGLVVEMGRGDSSGGRRPNIYGLAEDGFYIAGISISINQTIISIFNASGQNISGRVLLPVEMKSDIRIFKDVSSRFDKLISDLNIERKKLLAIGIELPGLINQKAGINKTYFPQTENLPGELRNIFGVPVYISHDSKVRAFAEQHFGLAKGKKHVLMVQVDWGVGLGIIINGKLYGGKSGYSGEFGHLPLPGSETLCSCGKKGCLETMASATSIVRRAIEQINLGQKSLIRELVKDRIDQINFLIILKAANQGDQFAISLFSDAGYRLGQGITYLLQLFNPELIVLGGQVAEAEPFIYAPLQQAINSFSNRDISNDTSIKFSALGTQAGTVGAAAFALEQLSVYR